MNLLILLLFGHLVSDFVFQLDKSCAEKLAPHLKTKLKAHLKHIAIYLGTSLALLALTGKLQYPVLLGLLVLTVAHGTIDWGKSVLVNRIKSLPLFIADQAIHLCTITLAVWLLEPGLSTQFNFLAEQFLAQRTIAPLLSLPSKLFLTGSILILATSGGNVIIREILTSLNIPMSFNENSQEKDVKTGRYIGGVERILTIIALVAGSYEGIVALYASKTAIRFKHASASPEFEEYYILGTLQSALLGIICGILLKLIL